MDTLPFVPSKNFTFFQNCTSEIEKKQFLKSLLPNYKLSATHILNYKRCSYTFLFENLLKVKYPPNLAMIKGSIIHSVLDWIFKHYKENNSYPDLEQRLESIQKIKTKEEQKYQVFLEEEDVDRVVNLVNDYFNQYHKEWNTIALTEFYVFKHIWNSVPLTGFIDKIEFNGRNINIVDYKTGNIENAKNKFERNESYWFQMVFYTVLIEEFKPQWNVESVEMCIFSDQFLNLKKTVSEKDKAMVKDEILDVYSNISDLKFERCNQENCFWCNNFTE